jgi:hypothetical protein
MSGFQWLEPTEATPGCGGCLINYELITLIYLQIPLDKADLLPYR